MSKLVFTFVVAVLITYCARADSSVAELIRIHVITIGGKNRVAALSCVRASGRIMRDGESIPFTMIAQRPDRVRMEFLYPDGLLIEATDGIHRPWRLDTRHAGARPGPMDDADARAFIADSDFDDPLIDSGHGFTVESAGTTMVDGRVMPQLLVTRRLATSFFLIVDPRTYFIVRRVDPPSVATDERATIQTDYAAFRPVAGVLTAHQTTVRANGRVLEQINVDYIQPNPTLDSDVFSPPDS